MNNELVGISPELKKLIDSVPVELLRPAAERYASLDEDAKGSWKVISSHGKPQVLAWTDWEDGFDLITMSSGDTVNRLMNYPITAKSLDIPAGWAYTTLDTYVLGFEDGERMSISDQEDGFLGNARLRASGDPYETDPEVEEDDE